MVEYIANIAINTLAINPQAQPVPLNLMKAHYQRKHNGDYGQQIIH